MSEYDVDEYENVAPAPPPEVDIPNADTEIPVQVEQVNADESTEDNLTDSNTQTGTPAKERSPIAKNNAKQILDKRKNNDEEVKSKVDGDESTIGMCKTQARRKDLNFRRSRSKILPLYLKFYWVD